MVSCWLLSVTCIKLCWHLPPAVFVHVFLARICICVGAPDWESAWATAYWSSPPAGGSGCDLLIQGERVWSSPLLTYWHHHHHHRHLINQSGGGNMQMCIRIRYFVVVGSITQPGPTLKICLTVNDEKCQNVELYWIFSRLKGIFCLILSPNPKKRRQKSPSAQYRQIVKGYQGKELRG